MNSAQEDDELMCRIQSGDQDAFEALVNKHMTNSFYFIQRMVFEPHLAEDILQEGFLRVWESRSKYTPKGQFKTWFYQILSHLSIDHLRKAKNQRKLDDFIGQLANSASPDSDYTQSEQKQKLLTALNNVKTKDRAILILHYYQGFKQSEIAKIFNTSTSAVESSLFHTRKWLREVLNDDI